MKPVIFLNSHPIQYFAPLYQKIANETNLSIEVVYCSDESIRGKLDKGFGKDVKWDIPLLEGYSFVFLKNYSFHPSIYKGFWGLINIGVIKYLYKKSPSVIIIYGWRYFTDILTILFAKLMGHSVCLRAETPLNQEKQKKRFITSIKHLYLRFLFLFIDNFLFIGQQNRLFYLSLGVSFHKLISAPYCIDNKRFREIFRNKSKSEVRKELNISQNDRVILYSGKYILKKRPLDLLQAFSYLPHKDVKLIMVGDGELRGEMENFINQNSLQDRVILTGFINQSVIPLYYRAADVFVMCSGLGETWGLAVNEAMNFGLPVIVSGTCGCSYDLVKNGVNGNVFQTGNIEELSKLLEEYINKSKEDKNEIEKVSLNTVEQYSYKQVIEAIQLVANK